MIKSVTIDFHTEKYISIISDAFKVESIKSLTFNYK